ncbi:hypothetical protein ACK8HY_15400, partial [Sphingobacterium sp. NGMCC 1.201703]|uniref:hypothetical protein n=1 Tax=Sphingobacterium sp. NGMCC 1.201703 TaxID=3388657 RepID=UPI0039FB9665
VGAFFYTEALAGNSQGLLSFAYFTLLLLFWGSQQGWMGSSVQSLYSCNRILLDNRLQSTSSFTKLDIYINC